MACSISSKSNREVGITVLDYTDTQAAVLKYVAEVAEGTATTVITATAVDADALIIRNSGIVVEDASSRTYTLEIIEIQVQTQTLEA